MKKSCIIIGGGIGGLFTGAFLSKNGVSVTVLEKNSIIGGGLQCFHRNGKIYETGMHIVGGFEPSGSLTKICTYLGILDKLNIQHIPHECSDEIYISDTNERYKIASGRDAFIECLTNYFPAQKQGIKDYVEALYRLTEEVPMFYLRHEQFDLYSHSKEYYMPADEFISQYITDDKLKYLLAYLNPLYGGVKGHTPAYIHALLNVLYINGAARFIAGSQQLADALAEIICQNGGQVVANAEVADISIAEHNVKSIITTDGHEYVGDWYVSSLHPTELLKMVPKGTFRKVFVNRLKEIPNTYSAFSLYLDLKSDSMPYIDHTCYYVDDYKNIWNQDEYDDASWPHGFMYMTPPDENQGEYASRMLVHCAMDFDQVKQWDNTTVGHRGNSYLQWKKQHVEKVVNKLELVLPGIRQKILNVYAASPLTVRDYYNTKDGSVYGYRKDCSNMIFSQLAVYTKVKNLFLTGQNVNLHGICGVPLTAINTAEAILGDNVILNTINDEAK